MMPEWMEHLCVKDNRSRRWPLRGREKGPSCVSIGRWRTLINMFLLAWVIFLLRTDRQTAPMHTGAIQGNCVKVTSRRKIKPPEPFSALRSRPLHVALFIFFFTFSPSPWISLLSLSLSPHSLSLWISLYQCLSIFKVHFKKLREP